MTAAKHQDCGLIGDSGSLRSGKVNPLKPHRHRWSDKIVISPNKSERECLNQCGTVKVTRHETQGGRDTHWTEFWRGLDRIECDGTPACEPARADA